MSSIYYNMSKKPQILYISLLPVVLLVVLALGAGYFLMKDDLKLPSFSKEPEVRRLEGFPTIIYTDQEIDKQREVIKDQESLEKFLKTADPTGNLALGEKINFEKEYLLGVTSPTQDEAGHEIKVKKLYEDKKEGSLLVSIRQTDNPESCEVVLQKNVAVDLVAISKTDYNIEFEVVKEPNAECL